MLKEQQHFIGIELKSKDVIVLGTPFQVKEYNDKIK
jgi:hypothetical protein